MKTQRRQPSESHQAGCSRETGPFTGGDSSMAKYTFALGSDADVRQAGVIQSDSFDDALRALGQKISVKKGDTLEIGVSGFPPARFECIAALLDGDVLWRPSGQKAA